MTQRVGIHPLVSPWGRFGLYSFFLDAPEPAIVDTGIASSPAEGMAPALRALGRDIADVRWILLTHGHIDHIGGAYALWELTGRRAKVVIHAADAPMLRSRRAHVEEYLHGRARYLKDPDGEANQTRTAQTAISGELEPDVLVTGGETLDLGGVSVSVHALPGHSAGPVAYAVEGQGDVFVGDAVQVHGAANGFPGYEDPLAARASLHLLRETLDPRRLYLGHPYRNAAGVPYGVQLDRAQADEAIVQSIEAEERLAEAAERYLRDGVLATDSPYSPFQRVADEVGYTSDPTLEPSPFFTTLGGYARHFHAEEHRHG